MEIGPRERIYMAARISSELVARYPEDLMSDPDTLKTIAQRSIQYVDALCNAFGSSSSLAPINLTESGLVFIATYFVSNVISRSSTPIVSHEYINKLAIRSRVIAESIAENFKVEAGK